MKLRYLVNTYLSQKLLFLLAQKYCSLEFQVVPCKAVNFFFLYPVQSFSYLCCQCTVKISKLQYIVFYCHVVKSISTFPLKPYPIPFAKITEFYTFLTDNLFIFLNNYWYFDVVFFQKQDSSRKLIKGQAAKRNTCTINQKSRHCVNLIFSFH